MTTIRLIKPGWRFRRYLYYNDDGRALSEKKKKERRIAFFMHANQLFIQYIVKTRGEKEMERKCGASGRGGEAGGKEGGNATASASDRHETSSFMLGCCNSEWT